MLLVFVDFPHSVSLPSPHPFPHLNVSVLSILPTSFHVACIVLLSPWFCPRKDPFLVSHDLHMREKKQCFSFWVRVTSLNSNILQLHAHSWISYDFIFLYLLIYIPHSHHSFISWRRSRLIPFPTCWEWSGNRGGCSCISIVDYIILWAYVYRRAHSSVFSFGEHLLSHITL